MTFPLDSINLLLDMVRGVTKFDLVTAIKAALAIAEYVVTVFGAKSATLPITQTPEFGLGTALAQVADQHKEGIAYARKHKVPLHEQASGVSISLLNFILAEVMKWIAEQFAK